MLVNKMNHSENQYLEIYIVEFNNAFFCVWKEFNKAL